MPLFGSAKSCDGSNCPVDMAGIFGTNSPGGAFGGGAIVKWVFGIIIGRNIAGFISTKENANKQHFYDDITVHLSSGMGTYFEKCVQSLNR